MLRSWLKIGKTLCDIYEKTTSSIEPLRFAQNNDFSISTFCDISQVRSSFWNFLHLAALSTLFNQDMQMNQQKHYLQHS